MTEVFDSLPGLVVPVGGIARSLARLWEGEPGDGAGAPSEFRAAQMNLVLHLGLPTTPGDGLEQFAAALRFTQRYPARIVVLCPRAEGGADLAMHAKIYSECFIGRSRREMSCIEAIVLSYPQEHCAFLEDQVSILVEEDLPVYYWVHRMSQVHKIAGYKWLLRNSKCFLLDTAVSPPEARTFAWPRPDGFRDLAEARLLPVRQAIGQFLSACEPRTIVRDLRAVAVAGAPGFAAEARVLLDWTRMRLEACGAPAGSGPAYEVSRTASGDDVVIGTGVCLRRRPSLSLARGFRAGNSYFESTIGGGRQTLPMTTGLLSTEEALGEAIFY